MKLKEAIKILKYHNRWRRGEVDLAKYRPKEIGQAIDLVIAFQKDIKNISDELLLKAGEYEDKANNDFDTNGVDHNLNIGRYDGLMMAIKEINIKLNL